MWFLRVAKMVAFLTAFIGFIGNDQGMVLMGIFFYLSFEAEANFKLLEKKIEELSGKLPPNQ